MRTCRRKTTCATGPVNDNPPHPEAPRPVDCDDGLRREARTPAYRRPRGTGWLVPLVWVVLAMGCSVSPLDLELKRCPCAEGWTCNTQTRRCVLGDLADAGGSNLPPVGRDASQPPVGNSEAGGTGVDDASTRPDATADGAMGPGDAGDEDASNIVDASNIEDASTIQDAGPPVSYPASGCSISTKAITACENTKDGNHVTGVHHVCTSGDDVCTFADACSAKGCVRDVWLAHDLGGLRTITRARFIADWWNKRPKNYQIWASNSPSDVPMAGATLIATSVGHPNPWRCVKGETCSDLDVPDQCCPDGRSAPQAPASTTIAKFDTVNFPVHAGRYWYLLVRDTYAATDLGMYEIEYLGPP